MSGSIIDTYGHNYCVIDVHNLFVGTTLRDELLLLADREDCLAMVTGACSGYGMKLDPDRMLSSYSGGEQTIICGEMLLALLPKSRTDVLFVHVLETLSAANRRLLLERFAAALPQTALFTLTADGPQAVAHA